MTAAVEQMQPPGTEADRLREENRVLREQIAAAQSGAARSLSRATRLAQVVSVLGQVADADETADRIAGEVAEMFGADIVAVWLSGQAGLVVAAHCGVPAEDLPADAGTLPAGVLDLPATAPLLAGPAGEVPLPPWLAAYCLEQVVWARLEASGDLLGYMLVARQEPVAFDSSDVLELRAVTARIALAIDRSRLHRRTQDQVRQLRRLQEFTARLAGMLDRTEIARSLAGVIAAETGCGCVSVHLTELPDAGPVATAGTCSHGSGAPAPDRVRALPLRAGGRQMGRLVVHDAPPADSEGDALLRHLADLGGLVLDKAMLFETVRKQAHRDALTGLANRSLFSERLNASLAAAEATGAGLAVIFIDLDGFKQVNDTLGHEVGDLLLTHVAWQLQDAGGPQDTVARLGGDEFVVLTTEATTPSEAAALARRLEAAVREPLALACGELTAAASIGLATVDDCGYQAEALMRHADRAMYDRKRESRAAARG
ncbi:diguanylate cyclase domain-containing protein [Actinoplanes sp. NPDC049681]|uniref:diguanylate cyclase domain-containing protein n=1 Tax=Actinoplanes sp. NPDC049681 TaxID=3363905 RepID=UPI003791DA6E